MHRGSAASYLFACDALFIDAVACFALCWWFGLRLGLGSHGQTPDVDEAGRGAVVEGIPLVVSSQTVVVEGIGRLSAHYLAVAFEELYPYSAGDISLRTCYIGG